MTILLALLIAAADPAAAYQDLIASKVPEVEAPGRVATLVQSLDHLGMPRSATVLLAALASEPGQPLGVRSAAGERLLARAGEDSALVHFLLAEQSDPGKLPPVLAVAVARRHLERALQMTPPEEGAAFETMRQPDAGLQQVSATALDKDLAAEMGLKAPEPAVPEPVAPVEKIPEPVQRELDAARALAASVSAGDPAEGDAREVSGLAALAAGDPEGATKEFLAIADLPVSSGDKAATERRDKAYLQLARLAYQRGDDVLAGRLYERVGRGAPEWLDALFESSWAHFRRAEDEKALGNLLTLHAPFFQERFFPESFILKALIMYENCRYPDARAALAEFQQRYQPLHDGLVQALAAVPTPQAAADLLLRGPVGVQQGVPAAAREEVARIEQDGDLRGTLVAAVGLAQEIDAIDARPESFRSSALIGRVAPPARQARMRLLTAAGHKLIARIDAERAALRELLAQSLRLSYEIAGREKELASTPDAVPYLQGRPKPPEVADDEELWPFQGEYWRDELGSYQYQLARRCKRPREPLQTASQPEPAPKKVAASPKN